MEVLLDYLLKDRSSYCVDDHRKHSRRVTYSLSSPLGRIRLSQLVWLGEALCLTFHSDWMGSETAGYDCAGDVIMLNTRVSQIDALPRR